MDYKAIIKNFEINQDYIEEQINALKAKYPDEEKLWEDFDRLGSDFFLNNRTINFLADSLQIVNNNRRIKQFELQDIKYIYKLLVRFYPNDVQYHTDLISFVYNVLDDEREAKVLIKETILLVDEKRKHLEGILKSIEGNE